MNQEVVVTRKWNVTIPAKLWAKYRRGATLEVLDTGKGILFKPKASLYDATGSAASEARVSEMRNLLDKLRKEDA